MPDLTDALIERAIRERREAIEERDAARVLAKELAEAAQAVLDWYEPEQWAGPHDWLKTALAKWEASKTHTHTFAWTPDGAGWIPSPCECGAKWEPGT